MIMITRTWNEGVKKKSEPGQEDQISLKICKDVRKCIILGEAKEGNRNQAKGSQNEGPVKKGIKNIPFQIWLPYISACPFAPIFIWCQIIVFILK